MYLNPPPNPERGIALVSVLWALLLLSGLALCASYVARTGAFIAHRSEQIAQAEAAANAALISTLSQLADEEISRHPSLDGRPLLVPAEDAVASVAVDKETGRIDVNEADDDLIVAYLESKGVPADEAAMLVRELRDRTKPPLSVANFSKSPNTTMLYSIEDLRQLPNWAKEGALDCWLQDFTVYSRQSDVSPRDAVPAVLDALNFGREHHIGERGWSDAASAMSTEMSPRSAIGELLRITSSVALAPETTVSVIWIGRLTGERTRPLLTFRWARVSARSATSCARKETGG
jgi:hypothetical protein